MTPTLIAILAVALIVAVLIAVTVVDGIQDERRIAQQRPGDAGQLGRNLLAGCWVPVLLFVVTLLALAAFGR